mgnify:CR=1 FL=1
MTIIQEFIMTIFTSIKISLLIVLFEQSNNTQQIVFFFLVAHFLQDEYDKEIGKYKKLEEANSENKNEIKYRKRIPRLWRQYRL